MATSFPTLPTTLTQSLPAQSSSELIQKFRSGTTRADPEDVAEAIERLQFYVDAIVDFLGPIISYLSTISTTSISGGATLQQQTLTAASTNITASIAATDGAFLLVMLTQDATGGRQIQWGSEFHFASANIDTTGGTVSMFLFVGATVSALTEWYLAALPLTGQA